MHGVPADLDLAMFTNATLIQVCIGPYDLQFHFDPRADISVYGKWALRDGSGALVDERAADDDTAYSSRPNLHFHQLLEQAVTGTSVDAPRSFSLQFSSGHTLTVFDESPYESFSIQPGNVFV